jgi:hypothetical protein
MRPLTRFFHRRSITFSMLAFFASLLAVTHAFGFTMHTRPPETEFTVRFVVMCVLAFVVCIKALLNLIRDVERGYSPNRCSQRSSNSSTAEREGHREFAEGKIASAWVAKRLSRQRGGFARAAMANREIAGAERDKRGFPFYGRAYARAA